MGCGKKYGYNSFLDKRSAFGYQPYSEGLNLYKHIQNTASGLNFLILQNVRIACFYVINHISLLAAHNSAEKPNQPNYMSLNSN